MLGRHEEAQSACSLSFPGSILWRPCAVSWRSERLCSLPEHTQAICCGVRLSAQYLWCPVRSASLTLPCLCCPCGQPWPLASPSLPSGHQEQLCSFEEPGMMESGCPPPVLWHTEGVTRSPGVGSILFSRCLVPGTCQAWLRICFSKDQVRCSRHHSEALEDADSLPPPQASFPPFSPLPLLPPPCPTQFLFHPLTLCIQGLTTVGLTGVCGAGNQFVLRVMWGEVGFQEGAGAEAHRGLVITAVRKSPCLLTQEGAQASK